MIDRIQDRSVELAEQTLHQHTKMLLGTADFLRWAVQKVENVWPIDAALDEAQLQGSERQPKRVPGSLPSVRGTKKGVPVVQPR